MQDPKPDQNGWTLVELLLAIAMSGAIAIIAGEAMLGHVRTSIRMEGLERQRSDWTRTTFFIDAEVSLSQEVLTGTDLQGLSLPSSCSNMSTANLKFAIRIRPDLPLVFYGLENSRPPWLPLKSLYRCGPQINESGSYSTTIYGSDMLVDGLDNNGLTINSSTKSPPNLSYTLSLKGNASSSFSQQTGSSGRAAPFYIRPDDRQMCTGTDPSPTVAGLICDGSLGTANVDNLIESFGARSAVLNGVGGNNRILGTPGSDTLSAGNGDDAFIGLDGNDTFNGGGGFNRYVPGKGNDVINGGSGVDVVFLKGSIELFSGISSCRKASCTVTSIEEGGDTMTNIEVLVFDNDRRFLN
jgi:hypothetical protein